MADVTDLTFGSGQVRESSLVLALGYVRLRRVVWITICSGDGPDKIDPGNNGSITVMRYCIAVLHSRGYSQTAKYIKTSFFESKEQKMSPVQRF